MAEIVLPREPSLSPDGRMLLFGRLTADASDSDIYVIPFPIP